jgi:hypothetical protein
MTKLAPPGFPKKDKRLLGTWKSDRARTLKEWIWVKHPSAAKRKKLAALFGRLEIRFLPGRMISKLPHCGWETSRPYVVLGTDETSVAVFEFGDLQIKNARKYDSLCLAWVKELWSERRIRHINFEGEHYWISLGRNREFFRKIRERS